MVGDNADDVYGLEAFAGKALSQVAHFHWNLTRRVLFKNGVKPIFNGAASSKADEIIVNSKSQIRDYYRFSIRPT